MTVSDGVSPSPKEPAPPAPLNLPPLIVCGHKHDFQLQMQHLALNGREGKQLDYAP